MATIHISEADATADFALLMAHINAGEEVIIERDSLPVAILAPATSKPGLTVNDVLERFERLERERGEPLRLGADFADDLEKIVADRQPRVHESWD